MGSNLILISGGPGLFDSRDPEEHDTSWANYVTPPLLMTDTPAERAQFEVADEVWWFIFKPAFERRWTDDVARTRSSVKEVRDKGFANYVDMIETRATERGWQLRWFDEEKEFWAKMSSFNESIERVIYWGHARQDLWLSVRHNSRHEAIAPESQEIIHVSNIAAYANQTRPDGRLMRHRYPVRADKEHLWIGCNTDGFAQKWSEEVRVWSKGVEKKINFKGTSETGHMPWLGDGAKVKRFKNDGTLDSSGTSW
jgi:hypothetical protein